jgi:hypothetical protein
MHRLFGNIITIKPDSTTVGSGQPHHHVKSSGLASPVWTKQTDYLTGIKGQVYTTHHLTTTIGLA